MAPFLGVTLDRCWNDRHPLTWSQPRIPSSRNTLGGSFSAHTFFSAHYTHLTYFKVPAQLENTKLQDLSIILWIYKSQIVLLSMNEKWLKKKIMEQCIKRITELLVWGFENHLNSNNLGSNVKERSDPCLWHIIHLFCISFSLTMMLSVLFLI